MTIHHIFDRVSKTNAERCMDREITPTAALQYFVDAELAFGSKITLATPDKVCTISSCLGVVDNMSFSGSIEEMELLYKLASYHTIADRTEPVVKSVLNASNNKEYNKYAAAFLVSLSQANKFLQSTLWYMLLEKGAWPTIGISFQEVKVAFDLIYIDRNDPVGVFELCGMSNPHINQQAA